MPGKYETRCALHLLSNPYDSRLPTSDFRWAVADAKRHPATSRGSVALKREALICRCVTWVHLPGGRKKRSA